MFDTLQGNNGEEVENNLEQLEAPYVGMFFETLEQARNYYEDYVDKVEQDLCARA